MNSEQFKAYDDLFAGVVAIDPSGKVIYFNQAFLVLTQSSPRVFKSLEQFSDLFNEADHISPLIQKAQSGEMAISSELTLTTKNGHGPLTLVLKALPLANKHVLLTCNDLTVERALYEKYRVQLEEIKRTHEKILQTDKLATLGELSAGISHEINNPLTVAYGYAQNIEWMLESSEDSSSDELKLSAKRVTHSLEKISSIISNMKTYVRTDDDHREFCDLRDVVRAASELTHTGITKDKVELLIQAPNEALLVQGNRIELEQVLVNILKNSFDAISDAKVEQGSVKIVLERRENAIAVQVYDNGPGVAADAATKIFQPFYTTKELGKGSGLGLSISQRLIEKHRGSLHLLPHKGGACFEIELPTMEMSSMLSSGGFGPELGADGQQKILIVDNDPSVLNLLDEYLQSAGYAVIGSTGGEDALHILIQTEVDLVITDLSMPRMSGHDLAVKIRELEPDLPIIYLSGATDAKNAFNQDKDELSIASYLEKPFEKDGVLASVAKILGGQK